jgi:hypothetical protein
LTCSYTGEDGFELSIPNSGMNTIAEALVADPEVRRDDPHPFVRHSSAAVLVVDFIVFTAVVPQ